MGKTQMSSVWDGRLRAAAVSLQVFMGRDVNLVVEFQNKSDFPKTIQAHLSGSVIYYTGITANHFKDLDFSCTAPANQSERRQRKSPARLWLHRWTRPCDSVSLCVSAEQVRLKISAEEYMPRLGAQLSMKFVVTGQADVQPLTAIKVVDLNTPKLTMTVNAQTDAREHVDDFLEIYSQTSFILTTEPFSTAS